MSSRFEVDAVELPYLNRARLAYASRTYLGTGQVRGPGWRGARGPRVRLGGDGPDRRDAGGARAPI